MKKVGYGDFKKNFERYNFYLIPFLTLLTVVLVSFFVDKPAILTILETYREMESRILRKEKIKEKLNSLESLDEMALRSKITKTMAAVPAEKQVPGLLSGLERLANEASASIEGFTINPGKISTVSGMTATSSGEAVQSSTLIAEQKTGGMGVLDFQINLVGNYEALKAFLAKMENVNRIFSIDHVSFSTKGETEEILTTNLKMKTYYLPLSMYLGDVIEPVNLLMPEEEKTFGKISSFEIYTFPPALGQTGKINPFSKY